MLHTVTIEIPDYVEKEKVDERVEDALWQIERMLRAQLLAPEVEVKVVSPELQQLRDDSFKLLATRVNILEGKLADLEALVVLFKDRVQSVNYE